MPWQDHIVPDHGAGTRPILKRTRHTVQEVLELLGKGIGPDEVCASYELNDDELRACLEYASTVVGDRMLQRKDPGETKLHVSEEQLKQAFRRHREAGHEKADKLDSCLLLLIYAIECGLKRILLEKRGHKNTRKLDRDDLTHDLDALLKLLGQSPRFHGVLLERPREDAPPQRIHEALRYGRRLSPASRGKLYEAVTHVIGYIEEEIG